MDTMVFPSAPYFDAGAARVELTALHDAHGDASEARPAVLQRLKALVAAARAGAKAGLAADNNGRRCAAGLSLFQDELIRLIYDYTVAHVYEATNPSDAERMAIVATGGYGRGLLAPGSDIDLKFLLPYKQTPWGESVAEYILYILWDLGFKVGHATRTANQCLKLAAADMTIRTSLLDSRLVHGDASLFAAFAPRFRELVARGARPFVDAKMAERAERHRRTGESRYKVEPNIKDGKGGLRDLHTLHWLAKCLFGEGVGPATAQAGVFSSAEVATFQRCEDFLWTIRCLLHFLADRAEERLTFELQPLMAERLRYRGRRGLRPVERFMKHYFLTAKDVGDLTTILSAALELRQLKTVPRLARLLKPLSWSRRREIRARTDFRIDNERLNVADREVFRRDPVNLIRFFAQAEQTGAFLHPDAIRLIRQSLPLVDDQLRRDPEANRIFLELLTGEVSPERTLRRMNETGVLGRFIPDFGRIVAATQFNMYHHFTQDEHLIRTVGMLTDIEHKGAIAELPLSTEIVKTIQNRRALYVAAFLHDIGKGRGEDHSLAGARIARALCPRLGLSPAETETVTWLIEQHLTMSVIAQSRDIADPKTQSDFAAIVQSHERLKLLLLLTVADIRAVGPGVWNGWKGQLLRTLYYETEPLVTGGHSQMDRRERVAAAQAVFRAALADWPSHEIDRAVARQFPDYWLRTETQKQVEHARHMRAAEAEAKRLSVAFATDAFTASTELTIYAPNHPRLLSLFAGACAAAGANIVGASIATTRDGHAIDTFRLARAFDNDEDEARRARRISDTIESLLMGESRLASLLVKRRPDGSRVAAFTVEPEAIVSNALSDRFTVVEVAGRDRPGLLYDLTSALSDLSLDISSAHVTTFGERAVDAFYVTDLVGKQITGEPRQKAIRERLLGVLAGNREATSH